MGILEKVAANATVRRRKNSLIAAEGPDGKMHYKVNGQEVDEAAYNAARAQNKAGQPQRPAGRAAISINGGDVRYRTNSKPNATKDEYDAVGAERRSKSLHAAAPGAIEAGTELARRVARNAPAPAPTRAAAPKKRPDLSRITPEMIETIRSGGSNQQDYSNYYLTPEEKTAHDIEENWNDPIYNRAGQLIGYGYGREPWARGKEQTDEYGNGTGVYGVHGGVGSIAPRSIPRESIKGKYTRGSELQPVASDTGNPRDYNLVPKQPRAAAPAPRANTRPVQKKQLPAWTKDKALVNKLKAEVRTRGYAVLPDGKVAVKTNSGKVVQVSQEDFDRMRSGR